jgi:hypothetical protein
MICYKLKHACVQYHFLSPHYNIIKISIGYKLQCMMSVSVCFSEMQTVRRFVSFSFNKTLNSHPSSVSFTCLYKNL